MRGVWIAGMLVATVGCDTFEAACGAVGFGEAVCSEPLAPAPGPWRASFVFGDDACAVNDGTRSEGWIFDDTDGALSLATPFGGEGACEPAGANFVCGHEGEPYTVSLELQPESRSTATASLTVSGPEACESAAEVNLWASWRDSQINTGNGDPNACPEDYDNFSMPEDAEPGVLVVRNLSADGVGVFNLDNGGAVYINGVPAGGTQEFPTVIGSWWVFADGWDPAECHRLIQVRSSRQEEVWNGVGEPAPE